MTAEVKTVFTSDDRDMIKSLEKQVAAQKRVNEGLQKQVTSLKSVKKATGDTRKEAASGASAFVGMGKAIALMGGAAAMFRGITGEITLMNAEAKRGAEALSGQIGDLKARGQITVSDKDRQWLSGVDKVLATTTSIGGLQNARKFVNRMRSIQGIADSDFGQVSRVIDVEEDPLSMLDAIDAQLSIFGRKETGSPVNILNKLIAGGSISKTTAGQVSKGVMKAALGLSEVGIGDESTIGAVSALLSVFSRTEETGTLLKNFGIVGKQAGIKAESVPDLLEKLYRNKETRKTIEDQRELAGAFTKMRFNIPKIQAATELVSRQNALEGTSFSAMSIQEQISRQSPEFRVARAESIRKGREDVRLEAEAIRGEPYADVSQRFNERLSNEGMIERIVERSLATFASLFGRGAGTIIREGLMVSPLTNQQPQDLVNDIPMPVGSWPSAAAGYRRPASPFITAPGPIRTESAVE